MHVAAFIAGPWPRPTGIKAAILAVIGSVIPKANPDLDPCYEHLTQWWLELDDEGQVHREKGFNRQNRAIAAARLGENVGILTDLDSAPGNLGAVIPAPMFDEAWKEVAERFRPGSCGGGLLPGAG
jgi:hypothetical protein